MNEHGYKLGGENSGHIIFSKYANTGDGIITAIKLMQVMCSKKSTLAKLCAPLTIYPQLLKNVRVTDKNAVLNDPDVIASVEKAARLEGKPLILVSGNAPTFLIRARELMDAGELSPALVIAMPVGFVNVVQSKELIISSGAEYIAARGRKGGSNAAASVVNALMYMLTR